MSPPPPEAVPAPPHRPTPSPPPPRRGFAEGWERRLGILVPVWIGAIALTLAGAYLVKYTIERGVLGPEVRVALGVALGACLLGAGEGLRRRYAVTAQGASAAGVAALYAAFLAATVLYQPPLLPTWAGFSLIVLTTAAAVALSLRQGSVVAFVGLVGGFFTPYWIGLASASPGRFFAYLLLLQGALLIVTGRRGWTGLSSLTLLLGLGAATHRITGPSVEADAVWIGLFLVLSSAGFVVASRSAPSPAAGGRWRAHLGCLALGASLLVLMALAVRTHFGLSEWAFLGILAVACMVLGRLDREYGRLPWVAFALTGTLLLGWALGGDPGELPRIWGVAATFALVWGLGAWLGHLGSPAPGSWAWLASAAGPLALCISWAAWSDAGSAQRPPVPWALVSLLLAAAYLLPASFAAMPNRRQMLGESQLAAFCAAVTALVSLAAPFELERAWIGVAWGLEVACLSLLLGKLRVRALGICALVLAALLGVRLLLNPFVLTYPVGDLPVLNGLLYGYGLPAACVAYAGSRFRRAGWARSGGGLGYLACALVGALVILQVRQAFQPGDLDGPAPLFFEWASYTQAGLLLGLLFLWASGRFGSAVLRHAGLLAVTLALLKLLWADLLALNPVLWHASVGGTPIFNGLLYAYGAPLLMLALLLRLTGGFPWHATVRWVAGVGSILLGFALVTLEVRQLFQGEFLDGAWPPTREDYAYSAAWVGYALLLLALGIWRRGPVPRVASLAVMLLAVGKAFLYDLRHLHDLYRVASLVGLGASLLFISFLYQRFVFRDKTPP